MKAFRPLLVAAAFLTGCAGLHQPALPQAEKPAAATPAPEGAALWTARLRSADALYLRLTKSATAPGQPIWEVVQLLQSSGEPVTLGWAEVPATEQPLVEQWKRQEISATQLLNRLVRPERVPLLRQALRPDLGQVALGSSRALLAKIRDGEALADEEQAQLPSGYQPRQDAFENFADRVTASAGLWRFNIRRLYRAHLVAEQAIAENIVRFCREHERAKLLVLLPNDALIDPQEIADFVAQKMPLRQLILDRARPLHEAQPQLVAL